MPVFLVSCFLRQQRVFANRINSWVRKGFQSIFKLPDIFTKEHLQAYNDGVNAYPGSRHTPYTILLKRYFVYIIL